MHLGKTTPPILGNFAGKLFLEAECAYNSLLISKFREIEAYSTMPANCLKKESIPVKPKEFKDLHVLKHTCVPD